MVGLPHGGSLQRARCPKRKSGYLVVALKRLDRSRVAAIALRAGFITTAYAKNPG